MSFLRGRVAIVGVGQTEVGCVPHLTATQMYAKACRLALDDAGLTNKQIDGMITANSWSQPHYYHAEWIAEYMGINPHYCLTLGTGGGTMIAAIQQAVSLIVAGLCQSVLVAAADNWLSAFSREKMIELMAANAGHPQFEIPYGTFVPALYALVAQAHRHASGTRPEQYAQVAVVARKHAFLHPGAQMRQLITLDDVLNSKLIADPLHVLECALVSDGGAALVLTSVERARDLKSKPIYILGLGEAHQHEHVSQAIDLARTAAVESGAQAYEMADRRPVDMDCAMLYDPFTPTVIMFLEDLGFCERGEGGAFVEAGQTQLGGRLPVNTNGGLLAYAHPGNPGALLLLVEAVLQLRGQCGARQVANARTVLIHAEGGIMSTHATAILSTEV
ncbi:MAG: thiolase family protein [Acidobacteriota bacterium]|nr:thiolase family protein [Blastocatellia bacterium]MDW8238276.1 thiolase family protein [Acidobacteriota bacterium]